MHGLALESAGGTPSAALWMHDRDPVEPTGAGWRIVAWRELPPEQQKADQLILAVERLLDDNGLGYPDIGVIAVNRGPGSFTGIRSAVALGRGLALAIGRPVLGVTSHEAIAAAAGGGGRDLLVALDARRSQVYVQPFDSAGRALDDIRARSPDQVAAALDPRRWRLAGSGASLVRAHLGVLAAVEIVGDAALDAKAVAAAAARRLTAGELPVEGFALRPLYVRPPDAAPPVPLVTSPTAAAVAAP